jgi:predicted DCC family thiol-disulfide oxidoreductase YuxK
VKKLVLWTPGLTALHRVLTAALLALVPPDASLAIQAVYWILLALHAFGWLVPLPLSAICLGALLTMGLNFDGAFLAGVAAVPWWGARFVSARARWFEFGWLALLASASAVWTVLLFEGTSFEAVAAPLPFAWLLLTLQSRWNWIAWSGLVLHAVALTAASRDLLPDLQSLEWILAVLAALAFSPAWIPRRRDALPLTVFYDGECGFCHRSVQFLLKEDPDGAATRFAPLQGTTFAARVPAAERAHLPDSIVVSDATGALLVRSAAALRVGAALGGYWRPLAALGRLVPRPLRDVVYDAIASRRKRWFAKPDAHCPLLTPAERTRFDP